MSKRTEFNNGGFITPTVGETEVQSLVKGLQETVLKLGELLLAVPVPNEDK
jgi:hypothetical protein